MLRRLLPRAVRRFPRARTFFALPICTLRLGAVCLCGASLCVAPSLADERRPVEPHPSSRAPSNPAPTSRRTAPAERRTPDELARQIDLQVAPRALASTKCRLRRPPTTANSSRLARPGRHDPDARTDRRVFRRFAARQAGAAVDELLASPEYVRHMTDQWREHLIPGTAAAARRRHESGLVWLEDAFRKNLPYDQFVRGVLTADGMQRDNGAVTFLLTHQSLDEATDRLSRLARRPDHLHQCHDHPFADWKQDHYWGVAAFFSKVRHQYERLDKVEH